MIRLNPPKKRPRLQPFRKGEAKLKYQYSRDEALARIQLEEALAALKRAEAANNSSFNHSANTIMSAMELLSNETPFTGLEYSQAAEDLRQQKVEKWHDINKGFEAAIMAQLGTDLAYPLMKGGFSWLKNKAISPAAKLMMNPENFVFESPKIKPVQLNIVDETVAEEPAVKLVLTLFKKPRLALPESQNLPPESTYTGKTPSRILDLKTLQLRNEARHVLNDIAEDPNDYTFKEINQALEAAFKDEGTVPIKIDSSGEVIHLGNNTQEELKKVNAVLERYGYEKIPEGMDDVATRLAVLDRAAEHRTFVRGVYLKPRGSNADKAMTKLAARMFGVPEDLVTAEMKLQAAATHTIAGNAENGRQGLHEALKNYNLLRKGGSYDAIYTSSRDLVAAGYSNPGRGGGSQGKAYYVQLPVNDTPNTSLTQLWENNEFPIMDDMIGRLTDWRTKELPYMLKTGKPLSVDVEREFIDPDWVRATMLAGDIAKRDVQLPMKYSDTKPTELFIEGVYTRGRHYGSRDPELVESDITYTILQMMKRGVKPINPIRSYKLGPRRFEVGDVEVMDPDYSSPVIEEMTLKYPWALLKLHNRLTLIDLVEKLLSSKEPLPFGIQQDWRDLSSLRKFGAITNKQYLAIKKAYRFGGDPLKYIDFKKATQAAKDLYFKDIKISRSRDAWHRKLLVASDEKRYLYDLETIDRRVGDDLSNLMFKDKREIAADIQKEMLTAGVKPNYSLKSKDGYRVFTTEGTRNPDPNDVSGTHYVVIGPKDTRLLNVKGEYKPNSSRMHHGHSGDRIEGISRNLGGILSPLFLSGPAAYNYYKNDTL